MFLINSYFTMPNKLCVFKCINKIIVNHMVKHLHGLSLLSFIRRIHHYVFNNSNFKFIEALAKNPGSLLSKPFSENVALPSNCNGFPSVYC